MHTRVIPVQLAVALTFSLIAYFGSRAKHETVGNNQIYRYPPFVGCLMAGCGAFFALIPFFARAPAPGDVPPFVFSPFFWAFAGCAFAAALYFFRYRVVVSDTTLSYGTSEQNGVPLADVMDTLLTAGRNQELTVYLRDDRRVKFSGMLADFRALVGILSARGSANRKGAGTWMPKLEDQRKRAALNRRMGWIMGVGVALAVLLWIATRLIR